MRAVIQRVSAAHVLVDDTIVGNIGSGLTVFLGVTATDQQADARRLADKIISLRIFPDPEGRFDRSLQDIAGAVLVVSQFTLYGETRKGRRPSFTGAAPPSHAAPLIEYFTRYLDEQGVLTSSGVFGAHMRVHLINDGPVTLILDTAAWSEGRG